MRDFLLVVAVFIIAAAGASAVAWPLYASLSLDQWIEFGKFAKWLAILATAFATVGLLKLRGCLHWTMTGFTALPKPATYLLSTGVAAGFAMLAPLGAVFYLLGIFVPDADATWLESASKLILSILPAALITSLIEETYFRGIQFGTLIREQRTAAAIVLPAAFYAGVHFLNPPEAAAENPDWFYGTVLLFSAPAEICRAADCIGAGATLFLAGAMLALVRLLGGHLVLCIGIHAGWIIGIKGTKHLTDFDRDADLVFLAGGHDHFSGLLATLWLAVPCVWLMRRYRSPRAR